VEAGRVGVSGLPGEVPDGLVGRIVDPQHVDHEARLRLSPPDDVQPHLEPGVPSVLGEFRPVLCCSAIEELIAERGAVAVGVGDIAEEELASGADFELEVLGGVAVGGGDEYLDHVFLPERVIAVLVVGDDLVVDAAPANVEVFIVVAESGGSGVVGLSVDVGEGQLGSAVRPAGRNVQTPDYRAQKSQDKEIIHLLL
jgi:hypothetical protein